MDVGCGWWLVDGEGNALMNLTANKSSLIIASLFCAPSEDSEIWSVPGWGLETKVWDFSVGPYLSPSTVYMQDVCQVC